MPPVRRGRFITFEGGEGTGKSTQSARLAERLRLGGHEVVVTREPGGTPGAEEIRSLLVHGAADRWSPLAEALLLNAARGDHLDGLIRPALEAGHWVISDRFADSTRAYQGAAGRLDPGLILQLEGAVVGDTRPDLTLVLDLPAELGLERAAERGGAARFETKGLAFHQRLRDGYRSLASEEPARCVLVDADQPVNAVADVVWSIVEARLRADL